MPAQKHPEPSSGKPSTTAESGRKPWKKRSPVDIVLDQERKLRQEITEGERELQQKRVQLQKFEQARKIFEAS